MSQNKMAVETLSQQKQSEVSDVQKEKKNKATQKEDGRIVCLNLLDVSSVS